MADRFNQPPRDPEFPTDEPGAARDSREPRGLDDIVPGETREPAPGGDTNLPGPGLGESVEPQGAPGVSPEQPWGEPSPAMDGMEQPSPTMGGMQERTMGGMEQQTAGGQGFGVGGEAPTPTAPSFGTQEPAPTGGTFGTGAQSPTTAGTTGMGETGESSGGEGMLDSMKDALRKVKDAVTPGDEGQDEEVRPGPLPSEPQERGGHLLQEPQEGRGGGLR